MMTEICGYLKNWFDVKSDHTYIAEYTGTFTIHSDTIMDDHGNEVAFLNGQYFRIIDSVLNDGVWKYGDDIGLRDETFVGTIRAMAVPVDLVALADEITEWQREYGSAGSAAMSPFTSESFGGYSYSKSTGRTSEDGSSTAITWQSTFASSLARYRKI